MANTLARTLAVAGAITALVLPASAGTAFADTPKPGGHTPAVVTPQHHVPAVVHNAHAPAGGAVLRTVVKDARITNTVRTTKHSKTVDTLRSPGTLVHVSCSKTGDKVEGNATWYKVGSPAKGFIPAADLTAPTVTLKVCTKH